MTASDEPEITDQTKENPETPPPVAVPGAAETSAAAQLAAAQKEAAGNYDKFVRAVADLDNYRKRALREKEEARQFGYTGLFQDMIPVLDNLQLGLDHARAASAEAKGVADGVAMVFGQLRAALEKHGLKEINPAAGAAFDPNLHEAVSHLPSADVASEQILQVVRAGYTLNGRLLRPASVVVSSGPAQPEARA